MRSHIIHDDNEPVVIRRYPNEVLAELARSVLEASEIPAMVIRDSHGEVPFRAVRLAVRRGDVRDAIALLDAPPDERDVEYDADDGR